MSKLKSFTYTNVPSNCSTAVTTGHISNSTVPNDIWESLPGVSFPKGSLTASDIILDGKPLSSTLQTIEQRLAILHPNQDLEERWNELKALGDQYRKLEQEILEKEKSWNIIKNG